MERPRTKSCDGETAGQSWGCRGWANHRPIHTVALCSSVRAWLHHVTSHHWRNMSRAAVSSVPQTAWTVYFEHFSRRKICIDSTSSHARHGGTCLTSGGDLVSLQLLGEPLSSYRAVCRHALAIAGLLAGAACRGTSPPLGTELPPCLPRTAGRPRSKPKRTEQRPPAPPLLATSTRVVHPRLTWTFLCTRLRVINSLALCNKPLSPASPRCPLHSSGRPDCPASWLGM